MCCCCLCYQRSSLLSEQFVFARRAFTSNERHFLSYPVYLLLFSFFFIAYGVCVCAFVLHAQRTPHPYFTSHVNRQIRRIVSDGAKKTVTMFSYPFQSYNHESMCASHIYIYLYYLYPSYRLPLSQNLLCFSFCCWLRLTMTTIRYTHSM